MVVCTLEYHVVVLILQSPTLLATVAYLLIDALFPDTLIINFGTFTNYFKFL